MQTTIGHQFLYSFNTWEISASVTGLSLTMNSLSPGKRILSGEVIHSLFESHLLYHIFVNLKDGGLTRAELYEAVCRNTINTAEYLMGLVRNCLP